MTTRLVFLAGLAVTACLTGCLVPEKFSTSITVQSDGAYTYRYDGTAMHLVAASAMHKNGVLTDKDETALQQEAQKVGKVPGVKKITYEGHGRYDVHIEQDLKPGQQITTLRLFTVKQDKDGVYTIVPPDIKPKDQDQLKVLAIKVNGKAEVALPPTAKVISHNASSTPGLLSKTYVWQIGSLDEKPSIRFTLPH